VDSRNIKIELQYNNVDISRSVAPYVESIRHVDRTIHDKGDDLSVTFQNVNGLWSGCWFPDRGAKLSAKIIAENWFAPGDSIPRDFGTFEIDDIDDSRPNSLFTMSAVSIGITNSIRRQQNSKAWENLEIRQIAQDIADEHGFELKFLSDYNPILDRWEQNGISDLRNLVDICEYAGLMLKKTGKYLLIFNGDEFDSKKPDLIIRDTGDLVKQPRFNANSSDIYSACQVRYFDPKKKELIDYIFTPDGISGLKGGYKAENMGKGKSRDDSSDLDPIPDPEVGQILKLNVPVTSLAEAQAVARAALRNKNMRQVRGSVSLMGRPDLYSGMNVNVSGFQRWDSVIWNIEEIVHSYSVSAGYNTELTLRGTLGY